MASGISWSDYKCHCENKDFISRSITRESPCTHTSLRYQQLVAEKEAMAERWDEQNAVLVESHERVLAEVTEEYEAKLADEQVSLERIMEEKEA